jgi:hypothetical protein
MVSSKISALHVLFYLATSTSAFITTKPATKSWTGVITALPMTSNGEESPSGAAFSRRSAFVKTAATYASFVSVAAGNPNFALAARSPPTKEELERLKLGYERMSYLLDNFEQETTVCRENGGECKRDADPVRKYMGLRSTTDPLFQIEKVFGKIKYMDIDPDNLEPIFEACEDWNSAVTMSNSMAFISQFGEYNPGGGKDEVLKYLDESNKQVVLAKSALEKIMKGLELM